MFLIPKMTQPVNLIIVLPVTLKIHHPFSLILSLSPQTIKITRSISFNPIDYHPCIHFAPTWPHTTKTWLPADSQSFLMAARRVLKFLVFLAWSLSLSVSVSISASISLIGLLCLGRCFPVFFFFWFFFLFFPFFSFFLFFLPFSLT